MSKVTFFFFFLIDGHDSVVCEMKECNMNLILITGHNCSTWAGGWRPDICSQSCLSWHGHSWHGLYLVTVKGKLTLSVTVTSVYPRRLAPCLQRRELFTGLSSSLELLWIRRWRILQDSFMTSSNLKVLYKFWMEVYFHSFYLGKSDSLWVSIVTAIFLKVQMYSICRMQHFSVMENRPASIHLLDKCDSQFLSFCTVLIASSFCCFILLSLFHE